MAWPPAPAAAILDNFNRANEGPPPTGWTTYIDSGQKIISNVLAPNAADDGASYWNTSMTQPDIEAYCTVSTLPSDGDALGILVRVDPNPPNFFKTGYRMNYIKQAGTDTFELWRHLNGNILLASFSQDISAGDKVGIQVINDLLTAWAFTGGSWVNVGSVRDNLIPGTGNQVKVALYIGGTATTTRVDDYAAGNATGTTTNLGYHKA